MKVGRREMSPAVPQLSWTEGYTHKIHSVHTKCGFPEVRQSLLLKTDKIPGGAHFHNTTHVRFNQILYQLAICILVV